MPASTQILSRVQIADMTVIFQKDAVTGRVGLQIVPQKLAAKIPAHREYLEDPVFRGEDKPAWEVDSLVQVRLADDPCVTAFGNGLSMRNSEATLGLRLSRQRIGKNKVVTILQHPRGFQCEHTLAWREGEPALRSSIKFTNRAAEPLTLEMLASFSLGGLTPFARDSAPNRLLLHRARSHWSAEGRIESSTIENLHLEPSWTGWSVANERFGQVGSMPVNGFFPFAAIEDTAAGVTWAAQIAWLGSWQMEVYRRDDFLQLSGGLADREFGHWWKTIAPGESFTTPEALLTVVQGGLDEACQRLTSSHSITVPAVEKSLPIIFNEWCTSWGHPTHENIVALADRLQGSSVKYLVIDDGWAQRPTERMQENGDWIVDLKKFPGGMRSTCDAIRKRGLIPGIWFEFEVANRGSQAWHETAHQLHRDGRVLEAGSRHFWDFRDPWVHQFLADRVIKLLRESGMGYMKVDYNETIGLGCDGAESLGEGLRQHLAGVRSFFQKIRRELPELVLEICSSGGSRLEPSMLELGSMASFSDAHETRDIPILACNVQRLISARQNQIWAVLRPTDDETRLVYSLAATFLGRMCLSGDLSALSASQWQVALRAQKLYTRIAPVILGGHFQRFGPVQTSYRDLRGWQAVLRTFKNEGLVVVHSFTDAPAKPVRLPLPAGNWNIAEIFAAGGKKPKIQNGELIVSLPGDYHGMVVYLEKTGR